MSNFLVLDLETKHTFREFSDPKKLGISVVGVYDYTSNRSIAFTEAELPRLYPLLESTTLLIGYNIISFDLAVLSAYYPGNVTSFPVFDILDDIKEKLGRRLGLNDVASATLGKKKSGHGLQAIELYKEGKLDELRRYCLDDVALTRDLFNYGIEKGEIFYPSLSGKTSLSVDWKKHLSQKNGKDISLTLPF